jgi:cytochrome c oxidase cbb3-type subunit 1
MYSTKLVNLHFWLATIGILIYIVSMWISGIMQGLMWRDYDEFGTLTYTFAESVAAMHPYYVLRTVGGFIYTVGVLVMFYNMVMTIRRAGSLTTETGTQTATAQA